MCATYINACTRNIFICVPCGDYLSCISGSGEDVPDVVGGIGVQQSLHLEERRSV